MSTVTMGWPAQKNMGWPLQRKYMILSWSPNSYTDPIISEYLLTIVVDRDEDGNLAIVGLTDHNVEISR